MLKKLLNKGAMALAIGCTSLTLFAQNDNDLYEETIKEVDKGGLFLAYLKPENITNYIVMPEDFAEMFREVLSEKYFVDAIALSSKNVSENLFLNRSFTKYTDENSLSADDKVLFNLMTSTVQNKNLEFYSKIPADATSAVGFSLNMKNFWKYCKATIAKEDEQIANLIEQQVKINLGVTVDELCDSLDGEIYFVTKMEGENSAFLLRMADNNEVLKKWVLKDYAPMLQKIDENTYQFNAGIINLLIVMNNKEIILSSNSKMYDEFKSPKKTAVNSYPEYFKNIPSELYAYALINIDKQDSTELSEILNQLFELDIKIPEKFKAFSVGVRKDNGVAESSYSNMSTPQTFIMISSIITDVLYKKYKADKVEENSPVAPAETQKVDAK